MKLYGAVLSPFVRKTIAVLNLKQLDFEHVSVFPGNLPDGFLEISPLGKIPAFEDDNIKISDSSVICEYLEEQYPDIPSKPMSPAQRAKARWYEEYADTKLVELCGGGIFFERVVKPLTMQQAPNEERVMNTIENLLPPVFDYVESQVPEQGFLFGDFGTGDIALVSPIISAGYADFSVDSNRWPKLAAFVERVKEHPAVAKALATEAEFVKMAKG
jgi:glutathione S-transferase